MKEGQVLPISAADEINNAFELKLKLEKAGLNSMEDDSVRKHKPEFISNTEVK